MRDTHPNMDTGPTDPTKPTTILERQTAWLETHITVSENISRDSLASLCRIIGRRFGIRLIVSIALEQLIKKRKS
jgi:hypothetical protein